MEEKQYIAHHGIKGMHWGVRRYQNPDGTLTEAGRARYSTGEAGRVNSLTREERKQQKENAKKQAIVKERIEMAKNDQLYWEHQRDITKKYLSELESGKHDDDFDEYFSLKDAISDAKYNINKYSAYAQDWLDSQKELMDLDYSSMTVEDLKKKTSRHAIINRQIERYDSKRMDDDYDD